MKKAVDFQQFDFCSKSCLDNKNQVSWKNYKVHFFCWKGQLDRESFNSMGKLFRQTVLLGTQNPVLTILSKLFCWNQSFSLFRLRKNQQDCFLGKIFLFKMFPGQEKCSFHNSDGKKIANSSFSSQGSEMIGKSRSSSKKIYHPIFPQDTENSLLTLLALSFFPEDKTVFCSKPKEMN